MGPTQIMKEQELDTNPGYVLYSHGNLWITQVILQGLLVTNVIGLMPLLIKIIFSLSFWKRNSHSLGSCTIKWILAKCLLFVLCAVELMDFVYDLKHTR